MAIGARRLGMPSLPVQSREALVAFLAICDGSCLLRLAVAVGARHRRHHRRGRGDLVALRAVRGGSVPRRVAPAAQDAAVLPRELHRVPCHPALRRNGPERHQRRAHGERVTVRAFHAQDLSRPGDMPAVVASEAARPVPVPDVGGVRLPVHLHLGEDTAVVNADCVHDGVFHVGRPVLEDPRVPLLVEARDLFPHSLVGFLRGGVLPDNGIHDHLFDPRQRP